ncbi:MAG: GTP-binding protein [Spirosomataceae bacterium]|jgi:GTP-binding protein
MAANFIDYVKIYLKSGNGGPGAVHFRREKHVPKGGPDGGDGGRGGHIIVRGSSQLWTLLHLKYQKHIRASNGVGGSGSRSTGADGSDQIIEVPLGTVIKDSETGEVLAEIIDQDQEEIIFRGGRGGQGNQHFKTATNQAPYFAQEGETGKDGWAVMELKILADIGLVGFPNAGKSTLLSVISEAKPEIADYPFTTLTPNLGVVSYRDNRSFVVADIPGIIEGAAEGKGLGLRFLRHIERNSALLFIVSAEALEISDGYQTLLKELEKHNPELLDKKRVLGISKADLIDEQMEGELSKQLPENVPAVFFSSVTGKGIQKLKDAIWDVL